MSQHPLPKAVLRSLRHLLPWTGRHRAWSEAMYAMLTLGCTLSVLTVYQRKYNPGLLYEFENQVESLLHDSFPARSAVGAFERFFQDEKVLRFKTQYIAQCKSLPRYPCIAGILAHLPFYGFGSQSLNALAVHFMASQVKPPRRYQLISYDFNYEPWSSFFEDFASGTSCPLYRSITNNVSEGDEYLRTERDIRLYVPSINFTLTGGEAQDIYFPRIRSAFTMIKHNHTLQFPDKKNYGLTVRVASQIRYAFTRAFTTDFIFRKQSELMKSLWQPLPEFRDLLQRLFESLISNHNHYFGIHIRRGDKVFETKAIPFESYAEKVREVCRAKRQSPAECPSAIFLASDKRNSHLVLAEVFGGHVPVYSLSDVMKLAGLDPGAYLPVQRSREWASVEHFWTPEEKFRHTRVLVMELTLLALSDEVICTYSSNICRMSALLRGNSTDRIYSLDLKHWPPE